MSHIPPAARFRLAWLLAIAFILLPAIIAGAGVDTPAQIAVDPVSGFIGRFLPVLFGSLISGVALIYTNSILLKEQMNVMRAEQERTRTETRENTKSIAQIRTLNGAMGREIAEAKKAAHEITGRVTEAEQEIARLDEADKGMDRRVVRIERTLNGRLREASE